MTRTHSLTEREREALEHMRKAQELGTTLKEYGRISGDVCKCCERQRADAPL
jgi:hypothetical protein